MMDGTQKSDGPIVPTKLPNNAMSTAAEVVEERGPTKGNTTKQNSLRTQRRASGEPSALERVRQRAKQDKMAKFSALFHHVTRERLRSAFLQTKKRAAAGVDEVTWESYAVELDKNIAELHDRLQRGAYRAKPSRRVFIPKPDGSQRPLGIASLEDKIVQRAVVEVMNAVYEADFLGFSYGFRERRSQHHALDALATGIVRKKVNYVLDADIRGYFDSIDHEWLLRFLEHRIADKRLLRLIQKWLAAGVLEDGRWSETKQGSPQGATVSPLLANVYLHYVFDLWVQQWRHRKAKGEVIVVRYADDTVVAFQNHREATNFLEDLHLRMGRFRLELHPKKTRLISFGRFAAKRRQERGLKGAPETFDFLGLTHICGRARAGRGFVLVRHTVKRRMQATLKRIRDELMRRRHLSIPQQGKWLRAAVQGYFAYHAVPTNGRNLAMFRKEVERRWLFALRRRSQRHRLTWTRMQRIARRWLPMPKVIHPWPEQRFDARTQGRSRVR